MWQRFTETARKVVFNAQEEALTLGESYVSTEHFLLALTREGSTHVAAQMLMRQHLTLDAVYSTLKRQVAQGEAKAGQDMQLTPRAKRVIDLAFDEAKTLEHNYIGTEHLLLGLIREAEGLAGRVLLSLGITLESTHAALQVVMEERQKNNEATANAPDNIGQTKAKPMTPDEEVAERAKRLNERFGELPTPGDFGTLQSHTGRTEVEVADDMGTLIHVMRIIGLKDDFGYRELEQAGQFVRVPVGTTLKLLERGESSVFLRVRVWDGDHAGKAGWVNRVDFQRTGLDERPFPPPE